MGLGRIDGMAKAVFIRVIGVAERPVMLHIREIERVRRAGAGFAESVEHLGLVLLYVIRS